MTSENATTTDEFAIRFKLRDIDKINPWGKPGQETLHWFALTSGVYCIDTPVGRLLEHTGEFDPDLGEPWCDYYVVRLFEDLCEPWGEISESVPADVAERYFAWEARGGLQRLEEGDDEDMALFNLWSKASSWWHARELHFSYLQHRPRARLWRTGSEAHLDWTAEEPWLPRRATLSLPFATVHDAMVRFTDALLAAMAERVNFIQRTNWQPEVGVLDIPQLVAEQPLREAFVKTSLARVQDTDWDLVRRGLDQIGA